MDESPDSTEQIYDEAVGMKPQAEEIRPKREGADDAWFGIVLISIGILFLLNTFGVVPWDVWGQFWRFCPLLLVFTGVKLVLGKSFLANVISLFLVSVVVILVMVYTLSDYIPAIQNWTAHHFTPFFNFFSSLPF